MLETTNIIERLTVDESETYALGFDFSNFLEPESVVALFGEVGAGKTVFVRGVCDGLGAIGVVSSPTFIIMKEYAGRCRQTPITIRHFDFYRITKATDIEELGFVDFLAESGTVSLIEWADHALPWLPSAYWRVDIRKPDDARRELIISRITD